MDGLLCLQGKKKTNLPDASTIVIADVSPLIDVLLKKLKSICHKTPKGSFVVSTNGPLLSFIAIEASHIGHLKGRGANLLGILEPQM